jgi:hypothetical protein
MQYVGTDELRRTLREVLDDVRNKGEHIGIERYSRTDAYLVPPEWYEAAAAALAKQIRNQRPRGGESHQLGA